MAERAYLSIGEVLTLLKAEFVDVTISKIRFLESQGLLDPERTPSGYRKFYDADVERLRWILRQQRENFLPLKVIKGRLGIESGDDASEAAPEADGDAPGPPAVVSAATVSGPGQSRAAAPPGPVPVTTRAQQGRDNPILSPGLTGVNLTMAELSSATGLGVEQLAELERYGFIAGRPVAGTVYYDEEALVVANLAAGFGRFGIEARHLRIYKNAADREVGVLEQVVTPLLKQRNPAARLQAGEALEELCQLGQRLRAAMLRQAVKGLTGPG
ncbi:MAG: MerR family transcriptional regulator [Acidimicrobiales bacterium]